MADAGAVCAKAQPSLANSSREMQTQAPQPEKRRLMRTPVTQPPSNTIEAAPAVSGSIRAQSFDRKPALAEPSTAWTALIQTRPDYAISLDWQFEYVNTAMAWRFQIENKGLGTPPSTLIDDGWAGKESSAVIVVSVGNPCPGTTTWLEQASFHVPPLKPGESTLLPLKNYRMPDDKVGKGCQFKAEIIGIENDANPDNNAIQMFSKVALLPNLTVEYAEYTGGPGGGLQVKNAGTAGAGPSQLRYECKSSDPTVSCAKAWENYAPNLVLEVPVPALQPGQTFIVKGATPGNLGNFVTVFWSATADHQKEVIESNEGDNVMKGGL